MLFHCFSLVTRLVYKLGNNINLLYLLANKLILYWRNWMKNRLKYIWTIVIIHT